MNSGRQFLPHGVGSERTVWKKQIFHIEPLCAVELPLSLQGKWEASGEAAGKNEAVSIRIAL